MFTHIATTDGEHLCQFLFLKLVVSEIWDRLQDRHLHTTGRAVEYRSFFQEGLALNMTRRLILAGKHAMQFKDASDSGFLAYLNPYIQRWGLRELDRSGSLSRLVQSSVIASNHAISPTLRKSLYSWAQRQHPHCYLCGIALTFGAPDLVTAFTLDHIWPQAYGGDSIEDNLLPACSSCNSKKKRDFPSWASCNVQSFVISREPSDEETRGIEGTFKFALHNRVARSLASGQQLSLKESYLTVGPWKSSLWFFDDEDVGDFFNVTNIEPKTTGHEAVLLQMS